MAEEIEGRKQENFSITPLLSSVAKSMTRPPEKLKIGMIPKLYISFLWDHILNEMILI